MVQDGAGSNKIDKEDRFVYFDALHNALPSQRWAVILELFTRTAVLRLLKPIRLRYFSQIIILPELKNWQSCRQSDFLSISYSSQTRRNTAQKNLRSNFAWKSFCPVFARENKNYGKVTRLIAAGRSGTVR